MDKFEYKTLTIESKGIFGGKIDADSFNNKLNYYGKEGWDLVSTFTTNKDYGSTKDVFVVLKRALP